MKKLTLFISILLLSCGSLQTKKPLQTRVKEFTKAAEQLIPDKEITILTGNTVYVKLEKNPSTGYSWYYTLSDSTRLQFVGEEVFRSSYEQPVAGEPVIRVWKFMAAKKGRASITFTYYRGWLGTHSTIRTNVYPLNIE